MPHPARTVSTGNAGLDAILKGGLPESRLYLLEGAPGSGKTTLCLQFLLDGVSKGEKVLYVTLSETSEELTGPQPCRRRLRGIHPLVVDTTLGDRGAEDQSLPRRELLCPQI